MIEITATVNSLNQGKALMATDIQSIYFGMEEFGLRLGNSFTLEEQEQLIKLAHLNNKKATVAVNGIMHPEKMKKIPAYLKFLKENNVDAIVIGDPGIIYLMQQLDLFIPFLYDGETLVTSSSQINFWVKKGAKGAVVAREVPFDELKIMSENLNGFGEIQVFGPTCIHQSKRPLLQNYFNYIDVNEKKDKSREWFLSEPKKPETHYAIYEDSHGTHIFANNDLNLMPVLPELVQYGFTHWKLDGLFTPEENFIEVVENFVEAKKHLENNSWNTSVKDHLKGEIRRLHPAKRGLDLGFFPLDPATIK